MDAEPGRLFREREAVATIAPELEWTESGWAGYAPVWPFERPKPPELDAFLAGRRLQLKVEYLQSYPMVAPRFLPVDPEPDLRVRTMHDWHVNGDGSLCMFQNSTDWDPRSTAADLIPKASGWFLEYLLLTGELIEHMTVNGIVSDDALDHLFVVS